MARRCTNEDVDAGEVFGLDTNLFEQMLLGIVGSDDGNHAVFQRPPLGEDQG